MRLTKKFKQKFIDKAKEEFMLKSGIFVSDDFFCPKSKYNKSVTSALDKSNYSHTFTIISDNLVYYWIFKIFDSIQIYIVGNHSLFYKMKAENHHLIKNFPLSSIHFISEENSEFLMDYQNNKINLPSIEKWNEIVNNINEYNKKKNDIKTKKNIVALDVDGIIKRSEMTDLFPRLFISSTKSRLLFYKSYNDKRPCMYFKLKYVYIDSARDEVYNRAEFEKCLEIHRKNPNLTVIKPNKE